MAETKANISKTIITLFLVSVALAIALIVSLVTIFFEPCKQRSEQFFSSHCKHYCDYGFDYFMFVHRETNLEKILEAVTILRWPKHRINS